MSQRRAGLTAASVLGAAALLVVAGATPAAAHTHPTPVELDVPAVVQVRTDAVVNISLVEHNRKGAHIGLTRRTYHVPLATSSGFAVDPTGVVLTTGRVVDVDLGRADIYAVNQIFHEKYGDRAPLPADPYQRTRILDTDPADPLNERLQRCYTPNTTDTSGGCIAATARVVRVLPFVTDQSKYGNLAATVLHPEKGSSDVAVLRVGANSMPTVRLASKLGGTAYSVLGFSRTPSDAASESNQPSPCPKVPSWLAEQSVAATTSSAVKPQLHCGHFAAAGKAEVKRDESFAAQLKVLRGGGQGGPVVGGNGEVLGFLHVDGGPAESASTITLVGPDKLSAALKTAGVTPHSGPTDNVYEAASHDYKNALYKAAIPSLTETLKLYPGHALASEHLADARVKAGTAADKTGKDDDSRAFRPAGADQGGDGTSLLLPSLAASVGLVVLAVVILLLRRRSRQSGTAPGHAPVSPYPATPIPGTAGQDDARRAPVDQGDPTVARVPVPRQAQATDPGDSAGTPATQAPGGGSARARAGSNASAQERWSRSRAAASGGGPFAVVKGEDGRQQVAPSSTPTCRVCQEMTSPDAEYCENCGYPTPGQA